MVRRIQIADFWRLTFDEVQKLPSLIAAGKTDAAQTICNRAKFRLARLEGDHWFNEPSKDRIELTEGKVKNPADIRPLSERDPRCIQWIEMIRDLVEKHSVEIGNPAESQAPIPSETPPQTTSGKQPSSVRQRRLPFDE